MLKEEPVKSAHHDDGVKQHEKRRHSAPEPEPAVQYHERNRQESEPDMSAQPALDCADAPERDFFSHSQQLRENQNPERDRAEPKPERRASDSMVLSRLLDPRRRQMNPRRQPVRMEVGRVKNAGRDRGQTNEHDPGEVFPVVDPHRVKIPNPKTQIPGKFQTQNRKSQTMVGRQTVWNLGLGASLEFGAWGLGFPRQWVWCVS